MRNTRIYGGERSVDSKYASVGKGVVKIIQLFPNISPSHPSLLVRRVAALQCGGNLLHHVVFVQLVHLAGKNLYEFIGVVFPYVLHQRHNAVAEHREAAVAVGKLRRQCEVERHDALECSPRSSLFAAWLFRLCHLVNVYAFCRRMNIVAAVTGGNLHVGDAFVGVVFHLDRKSVV